jgi:predicted CopG family antitoxin
MQQDTRTIRISVRNYNELIKLGSMTSSFDDVLSEVMEKAGIRCIAPENKEETKQ